MTELESLREKIDSIDRKIVRLLEERMEISRQVGAYKSANNLPILDREREKDVIQSRADMLENREYENAVTEIFEHIMRISRECQGRVQG